MYLSPYETKFVSAARCLGTKDRAAKIAEIHKQLSWLEDTMVGGPYLTGDKICHSDMTWFPTCCFIEYMLPRAFGWPMIFHEKEMFPKLSAWFEHLQNTNPHFADVQKDIFSFWEQKDKEGQFDSVRECIAENPEF